MTKQIPLTKGKFALVDDEDFEYLSQWKWHLSAIGYGVRFQGRKMIYMHRVINKTPAKLRTDHSDSDKLNNQKYNLRNATPSQNAANRKKDNFMKPPTSKYKGVCWDKRCKKWMAAITKDNKNIFLGRYRKEKDAALAYNSAASEFYGNYASLNDV